MTVGLYTIRYTRRVPKSERIMRGTINILGILLILVGIAALSYQGFNYTKQEKVAEIGDLKITTETQESITFPPLLGGLSLATGIILLVIGRIKK